MPWYGRVYLRFRIWLLRRKMRTMRVASDVLRAHGQMQQADHLGDLADKAEDVCILAQQWLNPQTEEPTSELFSEVALKHWRERGVL